VGKEAALVDKLGLPLVEVRFGLKRVAFGEVFNLARSAL
jgi:hypothetical protein